MPFFICRLLATESKQILVKLNWSLFIREQVQVRQAILMNQHAVKLTALACMITGPLEIAAKEGKAVAVGCAARTLNHSLIVLLGAHCLHVSLFLVLVLLPVAASAEEEAPKKVAETGDNELDSSWKFHGMLNKFERQFSTSNDDQYAEWGGFIVIGNDPSAFWLTTKGTTQDGTTDSAEIRLFYSYSIAPHIGVHLGWRRDIEPEPNRDWLGFGLLGVLPYKIGADASFFVGESDRIAARLEVAYKHWITEKWSLTPDVEANFYSESDPETGVGSGLSDLDLGLRLRYQVIDGLSPYAGLTWKGNFADSADDIESRGDDTGDLRWSLGVTAWL